MFSLASSFASDYIDVIETQNLFSVQIRNIKDEYGNLESASSNYYDRAIAFQDELNKKIYTNRAEMMKYQAMYYSMFDSQNISADDSYFLSENLTKAGLDIASLFNLDVSTAMEKIKSGISGQVEPLRAIGIDISESSLETVLNDLGIDRSVQELSYAEKELARYIAIVNQAGEAQGDFARTFNQPANQIKMLKNQLAELRQVIGSFIMNAFGGIIKYALATVIAIKNVLNAIGELFGWELSSDIGDTNLSDSIGADDLSDDLGTATSKAKELKKQLMGFDEINNITPNTGSSNNSNGESSVGGIDSALLDGLKEWDMQLESINDEVTELAEKIENKLMKAVDFVREHWDTILEVVKAIGVALLSWKIAKGVTDFLENLGLMKQGNSFGYAFDIMLITTGIYLMYQGIKKLLSGKVSSESIIETIAGFGMISSGIADFLRRGKFVKNFKEGITYGFPIALSIASFMIAYNGIKKIISGNAEFIDWVQAIVGTGVGIVSSGITIFRVIKKLKNSDFIVKYGNSLTYAFGIAALLSSLAFSYNGIKKIVSGDADFIDVLSSIAGSVGTGLSIFSLLKKAKIGGSLGTIGTATLSIGLMVLFDSITYNYESAKQTAAQNGYVELDDVVNGSTLGGVAGGATVGATIGSIIPGLGTLVGGVAGGIAGGLTSVISAAVGAKQGLQEYAETYASTAALVEKSLNKITTARDNAREGLNAAREAYEQNIDSIKSNMETSLLELDVNQELADSLSQLLDSNGKVKKGYEDRVDYVLGELNNALGTELTRNGDLIYNNGEVVRSYSELQGEINNTIEARKKEIEQEAYLELYKEAMKEKISAQQELTRNYEKAQEAYQNYMEAEKNGNHELAEQYKAEWYDYNQAVLECSEEVQNSTDEMASYSIGAFGEISASAIENGEITRSALLNAVADTPEEWEKAYSQMEGSTKNCMLGMSTSINNFNTKMKSKWQEIATSPEAFIEALNETDEETKNLIATTIYNVENLTPNMVQAWANMAEQDTTRYNELLSVLPEDTQVLLDDLTTLVNEFTPESIQNWADLAQGNVDEYNRRTASLSSDTKKELDEIVKELNAGSINTQEASRRMSEKILEGYKTGNGVTSFKSTTSTSIDATTAMLNSNTSMVNAANNLGTNTKNGFLLSLGDGSFSASNFIAGFTNTFNRLKNNVFSIVQNAGSSIVRFFNKGLDEHSPSKATALSAKNFILGFENMLDEMVPTTVQDVAEYAQDITNTFDNNMRINDILSDGIKVDENAFKADINKMLNYEDINGQIQTKIDLTMNGNISEQIAEASYNAFVMAMREEGINVNIEAKTEEGTIVRKVSDGVEDYVRRTGKMPFPVVIG